jgi:hypothetical protein
VVPGPAEEDAMATPDPGTGATQPGRHVLAVYAHPWAHSFTGFILHSAVRGVRAAGRSVEIADLYAEGFDPVLRHADYAQFEHKPMPEDVRREQAGVERSDALMFVFTVVVVVPGHAQGLVRPRLVGGLRLAYDLGKMFLATERT